MVQTGTWDCAGMRRMAVQFGAERGTQTTGTAAAQTGTAASLHPCGGSFAAAHIFFNRKEE